MRILHVIQEMRVGGAENVVLSLARASNRAGHDVAVAAAPGPLQDSLDAIFFELPLLARRPSRLPAGIRALGKAAGTWDPNVIHCHNPGMVLLTAAVTRRGKKIPAVASIHGSPASDYPRVARILRWSGIRTVACGPGVRDALRQHGFEPDQTIDNAVAPPPPPAERSELARGWGMTFDRLVVAAGRLVPSKGHDVVLRAVADLPDVALAIVGDGPQRPELEAMAHELQIGDRVVFTGERADARRLIGAADVLAAGSRSEGLPLVVLEAQAAGVPVVAADIPGMREALGDGASGLLVPPDDPDAMAGAMRRVIDDRDLARSLSEGGLSAASAYSEEDMTAAFLRLYEELGG